MTPYTLVDVLAARARERPGDEAFRFEDAPHTYGWLWQAAGHVATRLTQQGLPPGGRVVLAIPNGPAFFAAFYGILRAGGVAVPVYPGSSVERCLHMMQLCGANHLAVPAALTEGRARPLREAAGPHGLELLLVESDPPAPSSHAAPPPAVAADDEAVIQYTSGSTSDPRGVRLTHRHFLTNVRQMIAGMQITPDEVFVSWLPVYHDMGLILMTMVPFYLGARLVLLPASLRQVHPWLRAIERYRGTFTAAPDVAYRLCARRPRRGQAYDLSSLRVALNAAEPVRARTIDAFERAFDLSPVVVAGYGLAEATVGVSMWVPGTPPKVDEVGRVSVGGPFPEVDVAIVEDDRTLPEGAVGEIVVRSPANTSGYLDNRAANARLWWHDGYLRTGDLGYLDADGHLFVVGRTKNLVIQAGQTLYPSDVEGVVQAMPQLRRVAAVGIERSRTDGEHLYLFAELRRHRAPADEDCRHLVAAIAGRIHDAFGTRPARVYLLKPRSLPFTPNGKLQHHVLRARYLDDPDWRTHRILFPAY